MIYIQKKPKKQTKKILFFFILIIILIFGLNKITFVNSFIREVSYPAIKLQDTVARPISSIWEYFKFKKDLLNKIEEKEDKINSLQIELLESKINQLEYEELKKILDREAENPEFRIAKVLTRPPYSPYDTLTIDLGSDQGVIVGEKVFYKGVYIGTVEKVNKKISTIRLISSSNIETNVRIHGNVDAVASGRGGGRMSVTLPKDEEVSENDVVSTTFGSKEVVIGSIVEIEENEEDSFKVLYFNLPISINNLLFVELLSDDTEN